MEQTFSDIRTHSIDNRSAVEIWQDELATQAEGTRTGYLHWFNEFCKFAKQTPDEILEQRIKDSTNKNKRILRRYESTFRLFLKYMKETAKKENGDNYKPTTLQTIFASIRSFFEIHDYPLIMRKKDYPKGKANGVRRATKEMLIKVLESKPQNPEVLTALITSINDSGLGVSDLRKLKCKLILENQDKKIIQFKLLRQKTKELVTTHLADEGIRALKAYIKFRQHGTRKIPAETITNDSPLFRTWQKGTPKPMSRTDMSSIIQQAFLRTGEKHVSAHSIRKALQTNLEKGGMNTNWIDQVIGHELINSRDAYSLPTDEELQEAYEKAYPIIRIYPEFTPIQTTTQTQLQTTTQQQPEEPDIQEAHNIQEIKTLLLKGYKIEITQDGTTLMSKQTKPINLPI